MSDQDDLLTPQQVAGILQVSLATLAKYRALQRGPKSVRLGHRTVRYRRADLDAWLDGEAA